jgi:hypothetical protein
MGVAARDRAASIDIPSEFAYFIKQMPYRRGGTVPAPIGELVRIAYRSQDAVATALRTWSGAVAALAAGQPLPSPADARAAVDAFFDVAEQLLAGQRALAVALLGAGAEMAEVAQWPPTAVPALPLAQLVVPAPAPAARNGL